MITLYYAPHSQTHRQSAFFYAFGRTFKKTCVVWEPYRLREADIAGVIETRQVADWLKAADGVGCKVKEKCLTALAHCPEQVRVALEPSQLSFDVTVVDEGGQPYFFEFHEEQHARMTVDRPAVIYDVQGSPITVPRFLQRLYRDLWRLMHVRPFEVVWADWFDAHKRSYKPALKTGLHEYALPGGLRFSNFLDPKSSANTEA